MTKGRLHLDCRAELWLIGGSHDPNWSFPFAPIVGQDNRIEHLTSMHMVVELGKCVIDSRTPTHHHIRVRPLLVPHDLLDGSLLQDSLPIDKQGSEPTSHRLGGQQSRQGVARSNRYLGERAIVHLLCGNTYTDPIIDNNQGCVEITPGSALFPPAVAESHMTDLRKDWKK